MNAEMLDYLIIGAGPAGLQLAALFERDGRRDYLVLEAADVPGAFFTRYPRHRTLISNNKPHTGSDDPEFNLRMDWNSLLSDDPDLRFTRYTERYFPPADLYVRYLADFASATGARIRYGTRVTRIARDADGFTVTDHTGSVHRARRVVAATGVFQPYLPPFPGVELAEPYTEMSVNPRDFLDQRVLIIGKANSAFETADNLIETAAVIHVAGPSPVKLAWRTHYVGHLRAVNNNFLDTYQLKSQNAILDGNVLEIARDGAGYRVRFSFSRVDEVVQELRYDRVLLCAGFRFDASIFDEDCRPRLVINDRFPEQTCAYESSTVPDLFFAGTLTQQRDFKQGTSGFIHGYRYNARALYHILERRYHAEPWPAMKLDASGESIADAIIERVNRSSGLWQQFGVLADVVTVAGVNARYQQEVPVSYATEIGLSMPTSGLAGDPKGTDQPAEHAFHITLEYGPEHDHIDPFDITVRRIAQDTPGQAHDAAYLHPVVRYHRDGRTLAEHHLAENLENRWNRPDVHRAPLIAFLDRCLAGDLRLDGDSHLAGDHRLGGDHTAAVG